LVFSIVVFIDFTWMLYRFFYQVPSWLGYLKIWGVLVIAAYALSFALIESLIYMGFIVLLSLVFPARYMKEKFVVQGTTLAAAIGAGAVLLQRKINIISNLEVWQILVFALAFLILLALLILVSSLLFERFRAVARLVYAAADRMTVFTYLYVFLGLLGLVVVVLRNLL
jgi:hypothetical protein